ncbi:metallophosphoesterase [Actinomycetospora flava]|uniref:Metallophosphoesterase n=1 Tax=Actinomycetospora flava TaxID=3129232 RepID=A0ABU8M2E4_9PSEU
MTFTPRGGAPDVGVPAALAARMSVAEQHEWVASHLRRHPVSRRTALRGGAGVLAATGLASAPWTLAACAQAAQAPVSVVGRHLAYGADPQRRMALAGELTAPPPRGPVVVDLGRDSTFGTTLPVEVRRLVSQVPQADGAIRGSEQFFVHALADGLAPGERYRYRFRLPDGTTTPEADFTTAPAAGSTAPWSFTAFADQGVDTRPPSGQAGFTNDYEADDTRRTMTPSTSLVDRIAAARPAFHLLAGDICYADPSGHGLPERSTGGSGFDSFDPTVWTTYFGLIERSAASTPWMFATGNHDMEALYDDDRAPGGATHGYGGHAARLDLPGNGPSACPSVYTFRHGTVGVVSVDANDLSTEIPTNAGYSGGRQTAWLRETLSALRADPGVDWVVAFLHHCAFATSESHASDAGVRAALAPLCDEFAVDLVLQGHNHQYERTNPIRHGRSGAQAPDGATVRPETDGTTYLCVGSGGRPRYAWQPGETDRYRGNPGPDSGTTVASYVALGEDAKQPEQVEWSQARYLDYAYVTVDVAPAPTPGATTSLTVRATTDTGQEIDRVVLERRSPT